MWPDGNAAAPGVTSRERPANGIIFISMEAIMKQVAAKETIQCPACDLIQEAEVLGTFPHPTFIHRCEGCDYVIMESEWQAPDRETAV
jgi:hypothetical protein